tara:strand:- start:1026 stop:1865 length:840 start_codon:yes stop_codon:yes gene_type:complete
MSIFAQRLQNFRKNHYNPNQSIYNHLRQGQNPKILVISCSDSRIVLDALFQTKPGELFVLRNAGNIIPPYPSEGGEAATLEYALNALDIEHIIVCGHNDCGAMKGHLNPHATSNMPRVQNWLKHGPLISAIHTHQHDQKPEKALSRVIEDNVFLQLEHLQTYPLIQKKILEKKLQLHGWVYEFDKGQVLALDLEKQTFEPLILEHDLMLNYENKKDHHFFNMNMLIKIALTSLVLSALVCMYLIQPELGVIASLITASVGGLMVYSNDKDADLKTAGYS